MKRTTLLALMAMFCTFLVQAQFTFPAIPGPTNVPAGAPVPLNINDMANAAGVPAGAYGSFSITVDWDC